MLESVQGLVERVIDAVARVVCGGGPHPDGGLHFEPTSLTDVDQRSEIVQTEVVGPVLTRRTWTDDAELVEMANDTEYGLVATVFCDVMNVATRRGSFAA